MILGTAKKEDESYANANCTHRCMCGSNAAVVCLYFNEGYGSAISVCLFLVIMVVTLIQNKLQKKWVFYGG